MQAHVELQSLQVEVKTQQVPRKKGRGKWSVKELPSKPLRPGSTSSSPGALIGQGNVSPWGQSENDSSDTSGSDIIPVIGRGHGWSSPGASSPKNPSERPLIIGRGQSISSGQELKPMPSVGRGRGMIACIFGVKSVSSDSEVALPHVLIFLNGLLHSIVGNNSFPLYNSLLVSQLKSLPPASSDSSGTSTVNVVIQPQNPIPVSLYGFFRVLRFSFIVLCNISLIPRHFVSRWWEWEK